MAEVLKGFNAKLIEWAMIRYNISEEEMLQYLDIKKEKFCAWKNAQDFPTYSKLKKLSDICRKPTAFFFFPEAPSFLEIKADLRSLSDVTKEQLSKEVFIAFEKARAFQIYLEELYGDLHSVIKSVNVANLDNITELCNMMREILEFPLKIQVEKRDPKVLFEIVREKLYNKGAYVFKDSFGDNSVSGLCVDHDNFPVIMINNKMAFTRQLFTLFHELFHLVQKISGLDLTNDSFYDDLDENQTHIEKRCDEFANAFLVPDESFDYDVEGEEITENFIADLANKYCVSREVIMYKLKTRKLITNAQYSMMKPIFIGETIRENKNETSVGGNYYYTKRSYLGDQYIREVFTQLNSGRRDSYQASVYLGVRVEKLGSIESTMYRGKK